MSQHTQNFTAIRLAMLGNGYVPVPVTSPDYEHLKVTKPGKQPYLSGWRTFSLETLTPAVVEGWAATVFNHPNTGLLCGAITAVDIDIMQPALSEELQNLAREMLGQTPLRRIGKAPKAMLCYRNDAPMAKCETPELIMPDGTVAQVEVLGDGQQAVAFGIHPDTRQPYTWPEGSPEHIRRTDVPATSETAVRAYVAAAEAIIRREGGRTKKEIEAGQAQAERPQKPKPQTAGSGSFFIEVNRLALGNIGSWFQAVFPTAKEEAGTGAWRVTSADIGRGLEEDISIHPIQGGQDFGTRTSCSPIDVVVEHGGAPDAAAAALFICSKLGVDPTTLGWQAQRQRQGAPEPGEQYDDWPEPLDFLADAELTGAPELRPEHIPEALRDFVFDTAARMGVDPAGVAICAIVALASVASDEWSIQPRAWDTTWTENPRLWGAIVADPSQLKSPVIKATTAPIDKLEAEARHAHEGAMRRYRLELREWKAADKAGTNIGTEEPKAPRLDRYLVEGTTMEALTEVLRDDFEARQNAPAGKVLIRQDELSEWVAAFDRYNGGSGGADRGAYLRLYNGGRHTIDRVNRGAFAIPNFSACVLGGIQPGPIQAIAKKAVDDGLLQRFCFCVPARQTRGIDRVPNAAAIRRYGSLFPAMRALNPRRTLNDEPQSVVLHAEAHSHREAMEDLSEAMGAMPDCSNRLKSTFGKWTGLWARVTLVFHLIEVADAHARGVDSPFVDIVGGGVAAMSTSYLRDVLLPHLLRADALMFATEQTGHARWLAGYILSKGEDSIAARDIMRDYRALKAPEQRGEMIEVMNSLEALGWVRAEAQKANRQTTVWAVNPKVHRHFAAQAQKERAEREATKARLREVFEKYRKAKKG